MSRSCLRQELATTCTTGTLFLPVNPYMLLRINPQAKAPGLYLVNSSSYKTDRQLVKHPCGLSRRPQNKQMRPCPTTLIRHVPNIRHPFKAPIFPQFINHHAFLPGPLRVPFHTPVAGGSSRREPLPVKCTTKQEHRPLCFGFGLEIPCAPWGVSGSLRMGPLNSRLQPETGEYRCQTGCLRRPLRRWTCLPSARAYSHPRSRP